MSDYVDAFIHDEMTLEATEYKDQNLATVVINTQTLSEFVYIHLPVECVHLDLFRITKFKKPSDSADSDVDMEEVEKGGIEKYRDHPWVRIRSNLLDWTPGKHIYKFSFGVPHQIKPNFVDYYISYISQEDNPKKDYVYMRR